VKKLIRRIAALALLVTLVFTCSAAAAAAETFNAGVTVIRSDEAITVTTQETNDAFFKTRRPKLTIPCDFPAAEVTLNGNAVDAEFINGKITFTVAQSGTYRIVCKDIGAVAAGHSASLKGSIVMNFYVQLEDTVLEDTGAYLLVTGADGEEVRIPVQDVTEGAYGHKFNIPLPAKEMTDPILMQMVLGDGTEGQAYSYRIRDYADSILQGTDEASQKAAPLVEAMLFYGSYAQKHFGYRVDDLADAGLDPTHFDISKVTAKTLSAYANANAQGSSLVKLAGASLLLKSETTLRLFFLADDSVKNTVSFSCGGKALEAKTVGGYLAVDVTNISAKDLSNDVTVTIHDGADTKITYNPMTYCYNVLNNPGNYDPTLVDLVKALYLYNQAAKDYFGT